MSAKGITDELVRQVANDLCTRYGLDDEGMRAGLAARGLHRRAQAPRTSSSRNALPEEHRETFDRLAK